MLTPTALARASSRAASRATAADGDETGASAVEYGLLVAAIAALIVVIAFALGNVVTGTFDVTCDNIAGQVPSVDNSCG